MAVLRQFGVFLLGALLLAGASRASAVELQQVRDFESAAETMRDRQLPMLLLFSASYCGYCQIIKSDFLKPMLISGDYRDKVLIRYIETDQDGRLRDFNGESVDIDTFSARYNVSFTPTVVFLDANGHQLTEKMVGLTTPDYYGAYLDDAIEAARKRLQGHGRLAGLSR